MEWQPIETAPKDDVIDLLVQQDEPGYVKRLIDCNWCMHDWFCPALAERGSGLLKDDKLIATHWMPIPAAPPIPPPPEPTPKTKVYKVELLIVDHDNVGGGIKNIIEQANYPNDCISPKVMRMVEREVERTDQYPLNLKDKQGSEYRRLFKGVQDV